MYKVSYFRLRVDKLLDNMNDPFRRKMTGNVCVTQEQLKKLDDCSVLKILGLYLRTLLIRHKLCNMLSILNGFTLDKELHEKYGVCKKSKHTTTTK